MAPLETKDIEMVVFQLQSTKGLIKHIQTHSSVRFFDA